MGVAMKRAILIALLTVSTAAESAPLAADKQQHIILGAAVYGAARAFGVSPVKALAAAAFVGLGKEVYDHYHPANHTAEIWDAVATGAGGVGLFMFEHKY
jgi:hypothetical protein